MTQLTPQQQRAQRMMNKMEFNLAERKRMKKQAALANRGKRKINGRYYDEKAICKTRHAALIVQKEIRDETGDLPTTIALTSKGWVVYPLAS